MRNIFVTSLASLALAGCATYPAPAPQDTVATVPAGAVSAADPRAQEAGEAILAKGGSATDAAIAVMLALTVVEPQSSGIGGGGFLVRGEADGDVTTFDGRETAPAAATPDWFLDDEGNVPPFMQSVRSGLSVGVPGNIALAAKAHAAHGKLAWSELFGPAIELAREGFQINPRMHDALGRSKDRAAHTAEARALYYDTFGEPLPVGTLVQNEALARTFESLASGGREAFYSGTRALAIATAVAADTPKPGAMTYEDIAGYEAKERNAVCSSYRTYRICSMGPPTSGGVAVQQMLLQLERFDLASLGADNPVTWHLFLESQRLAYADREIYLADTDFVSVPVEGLLDRTYLAGRSALISPQESLAEAKAGTPPGATTAMADGDEPEEHGTSHFAVVDSENTMVSYTSTIEGAFGSGLMVGGFYLNNELTDFSRSPVVEGREVANRVEGGKRPRSSMSPTVIYDSQGRPFMAVGAAGGSTIPVTTARAIIGAIDFGLSAEEALRLPFMMAFGERVLLEEGTWLEDQAEAFRALGHEDLVIRQAPIKAGALLMRGDRWQSARDPRLEGFVDMP
ncbi:gamma-glutamyltransferase [Qipengyuania nanhaisediminis]|uniref:Glutathione hydrolase proenzyme n=1 Tax=Qipengyuania nanhaisediminis TaxID=604088 RepID=A0A1I5KSV4_9SPHN|nr:gamma-glutamyltransferase [Qipengyuania nanhaisediminis]SFO88190.1 gamma-glutamyltransferase 1 . Threonine peptidase. MEROPS family T03 [Qipengyuania nanhaisediminis]